jgi:ubiquinone/menaquinone biosynthesis C-methylase UbiE
MPTTPFSLIGRLHHKYAYEPRIEALVTLFAQMLIPTDRVLDVGCGNGILGSMLAKRIPGLHAEGIETHPRGGEQIIVHRYDGKKLPFEDNTFDVVIFADVLHHIRIPVEILMESARVAKRSVIVKDHVRRGWFSYLRICLLDWVANPPHGVPCLYTYWTDAEWQQIFERAGLRVKAKISSIKLYSWTLDLIFGGNLHFVDFTEPYEK